MTVARAERQARRLLWLFPAWLRAGRGEEAVGLVLDQLGSGARGLPPAAHVDLVRAGLHARRVGTPPPMVWCKVAWAERRNRTGMVPERWRPWLVERLSHRSFVFQIAVVRAALLVAPIIASILVASGSAVAGLWSFALPMGIVGTFWAVVLGDAWRRDLYAKNGFDPEGRPIDVRLVRLVEYQPRVRNLPASWVGSSFVVAGGALVALDPVLRSTGASAGGADVAAAAVLAPALVAIGWLAVVARSTPTRRVHPVDDRRDGRSIFVAIGIGVAGAASSLVANNLGNGPPRGAAPGLGLVTVGIVLLLAAVGFARRWGRPLGVWEVAPTLGPLPLLAWVEERSPLPPPPSVH